MPDPQALLAGVVAGLAVVVLSELSPVKIDALRTGAVATGLVAWASGFAPAAVVVAVILVLLGDLIEVPHRYAAWVAAAASIGGARPVESERWLGVVAVVAILVAVPWTRLARRALGPMPSLLLLAWVPAAIHVAVPDTEEITVVGGALAIVVAWHLFKGIEPHASGVAAFALLIVWATAEGARGREAAVVALGCFAVLLIAPVLVLAKRRVSWTSPVGLTLVAVHLGGAVAVARIGGIQREVDDAVWRAGVVVAAIVILSAALVALSPRVASTPGPEAQSGPSRGTMVR